MDSSILAPLIVFAPFFIYLTYGMLRGSTCPDCGEALSGFISPFKKTKRQWREGGYVCPKCGCEVNMSGNKVPANTPLQYGPFVTQMVILTGLAALAVVLTVYLGFLELK